MSDVYYSTASHWPLYSKYFFDDRSRVNILCTGDCKPLNNLLEIFCWSRRRRFGHATHDCVAPYVDIILHRGRFWAKSAALGSVRWCWEVAWIYSAPVNLWSINANCLQFDSGLYTTALLVDSAYEFAAASMSAAPIPEVSWLTVYHWSPVINFAVQQYAEQVLYHYRLLEVTFQTAILLSLV